MATPRRSPISEGGPILARHDRARVVIEDRLYLLDWCVNVADQRVHGTTHEKPAERFVRGETLVPVDLRPPTPRERVVIRRVPTDCFVAFETNRYPVPFEWAGRDVEVQILASEIVVHSDASGPVHHDRIEGHHQVARWNRAPRRLVRSSSSLAPGPPRLDPVYPASVGEVEIRPLSCYEEVTA